MNYTEKVVNLDKSKKIFNQLMKGKVINEYIYDETNNYLKRNELFTEIVNNLKEYKKQYKMNGMELVENSNFFYILDENSSRDVGKQSIKIKIYSSLIVLSRYILSNQGKVFDYLKNVNYGISVSDLEDINKDGNYMHILQTAKLENAESIINYLYNKNILLKTNKDRYILSNCGLSIVEEIIQNNS